MALVSPTPFPWEEQLVVGGSYPGSYTGGVYFSLRSTVNGQPVMSLSGPWQNSGSGTDIAFSAAFVPEPSGPWLLAAVAVVILARRSRMA
jgi:hypothetical protein